MRHESRDSPFFPTMYGERDALPDDYKFRGQRGRVRARYRRPQPGRETEKTGETSQRKTNLQLASGAFSCKVAPFTPLVRSIFGSQKPGSRKLTRRYFTILCL